MKLADYLYRHGLTPARMQALLKVSCRSTMHRYLTGERRPRPEMMQTIQRVTGGAVQLADFLDPEPPECAAVVTLPDGRTRTVLPWSTRDGRLDAAVRAMLRQPRPEDGPSPQALRAFSVLGPRVRRLPGDRLLLDDRPSDLRRVIDAANQLLRAWGETPIRYPANDAGGEFP